MTMTTEQVRERLLAHHALLEGHFVLSSGLHSDRYLQCAVALQHPVTASALGAALAARVDAAAGAIDAVVSPALGGLIIGHEVGRALGVRALFTERVGGAMVLRRGFGLQPGERIVLVEDVVTTGLSSRETLEVIRASGAEPVAAGSIANRSGLPTLDGLPLIALLDLEVPSWDAADCPLCATGSTAIRPGSRSA